MSTFFNITSEFGYPLVIPLSENPRPEPEQILQVIGDPLFNAVDERIRAHHGCIRSKRYFQILAACKKLFAKLCISIRDNKTS